MFGSVSNSYLGAKNSFIRLENHTNSHLANSYHAFMNEYQTLSHMQLVSEPQIYFSNSYFIPHHGIFQDEKKLRIVFNASARFGTNSCLNIMLHAGPPLQTNVAIILSRWRFFQYGYSAYLEKMYRQILIDPVDRHFQRNLWRASSDDPIKIFDLCAVTYGVTPCAFQAIRTLKQLAIEEAHRFP